MQQAGRHLSRLWGAGMATVVALLAVSLADSNTAPSPETAIVVRGDFTEFTEFRGELRAVRSRTIGAPADAGDLQLTKLAPNGSTVSRGDIVIEFDATRFRQAVTEKRAALKTADAEIDRANADARLASEAANAEELQRRYDLARAKLDVATRDVTSRFEAQKAELTLRSAERSAREVAARIAANASSARATTESFVNKRNQAAADLAIAERQLAAMVVRAPLDGRFVIQTTWRGPSDESEFRAGDRAWPGAVIAEIPDPASFYITARVDEVDRGRLALGMTASIRSDAVPGLEMPAHLTSISTLSRPDYSTWPVQRVFDVGFSVDKHDPRLRLGLSMAIKVTVDRLANVLLIPAASVHQKDSQTFVCVKTRAGCKERSIILARQSRALAVVSKGLEAGEEVAIGEAPDERRLLAVLPPAGLSP